MMKILIIEDEPKVAEVIKKGLEENGYTAEIAYDGLIGRKLVLTNNFEAIILDVNLPQINGYALCKELREMNIKIPILMLTALGTTDDKITGFDSGADDYLVKPFEFRELLARIKALLKRSKNINISGNIIRVSNLEMNLDSKIVKRAGKKIELTAKEFALLEMFIRNKGRVLSRMDIAEKIWDINFDTGTNVIDVYVNFLRKKIDKDFTPKLIHTQIGMGYVLKDEHDE
jgi:two-component system, OmpR family, copper resistance phosphate regulon response regulator CusR